MLTIQWSSRDIIRIDGLDLQLYRVLFVCFPVVREDRSFDVQNQSNGQTAASVGRLLVCLTGDAMLVLLARA